MGHIQVFRLSDRPADLGLHCGWDGLDLAGVPLLRDDRGVFRPRATHEISKLLQHAYGIAEAENRIMGGLQIVAEALNKGDLTRAMIAALLLKLPALDWAGAVRIAQAETALTKYDPDEPRDGQGRWSADGIGPAARATPVQEVLPFPPEQLLPIEPELPAPSFPGDILPPLTGSPDIAVPQSAENPLPDDRDCARQWADAEKYCRNLKENGLLGSSGYKGMGNTYEQCLRGQIDARCGGNPVGNAPGRWRKPKNGRGYRAPKSSSYEIFS